MPWVKSKRKIMLANILNYGKDIFLVGINFDKNEKNISIFEWEKLKD